MWRTTLYENLPWERDGITIRASTSEDIEFIHELNNDPRVRRFLGGPINSTIENTRERINKSPDILYVVTSEDQAIGYAGFIENDNTDGIDILTVIAENYQGKGYAKVVLRLMIDTWQSFFPDKKIEVTTQIDNSRAINLLLNYGFSKTGEYKDPLGFQYGIYKIQSK